MPPARVAAARMVSEEPPPEPDRVDLDEIREVVPARAVLTELARGFLLVHESNPARAVQFAETFLREVAHAPATPRADIARPLPEARLRRSGGSRGSVDPSNFPPPR
jgi:hypothetical protein